MQGKQPNKIMPKSFVYLFIVGILCSYPLLACEDNLQSEIDQLKEQVNALEKYVQTIEPNQSTPNAIEMSTSTQTPEETQLRTIYDDGFYFMGKDDALKIGGWAQIGYRAFLGESPSDNTFFIRRARLDIRGPFQH